MLSEDPASSLGAQLLRDAFATIARQRGAALEDVQDALGYAGPRTNRWYDRDHYQLKRDPLVLVRQPPFGMLLVGLGGQSAATA